MGAVGDKLMQKSIPSGLRLFGDRKGLLRKEFASESEGAKSEN